MGYATWILALLCMAAAFVIGLVAVYLVAGGIANVMKLRNRRKKLVPHG